MWKAPMGYNICQSFTVSTPLLNITLYVCNLACPDSG